jgi:hypothetical protein
MSLSPTNVDPEVALSGALVDVIDTFDASISERIERIEDRLMAKAGVVASIAALVGIGLATGAVSWVAANVALGAFVAADHGLVVAASVVTAVNVVIAAICVFIARVVTAKVTTPDADGAAHAALRPGAAS